ncbi:MAG TPA: hypothetical protein VKR22_09320 [Acidimicrobiales bacterium]|nr:hypothetical protein [Acidimicrobiales bacterium]
MMQALRRFGRFWYDFVVGDDWRVALGVIAALALTYGISRSSAPVWWLLPLSVLALLALSVRRAVRAR